MLEKMLFSLHLFFFNYHLHICYVCLLHILYFVIFIFVFILQLLPKHCALPIAQIVNRKKKDKNKKSIPEMTKPGTESYRKTREELTTLVSFVKKNYNF